MNSDNQLLVNQHNFVFVFVPLDGIDDDSQPTVENLPLLERKPSITEQAPVLSDSTQIFDAKQKDIKKHDSIKLLGELAKYYSDQLEKKKNRYKWRQAAIVLNRLFLIILCISIAMSIIVVLVAR